MIAALMAGGCGSEASDEPPAAGGTEPDPPATALTVAYRPDGRDGQAREATLTCEPAGGTHPRPAEACEALRANADALAPLHPDLMCTQIYGGPEEAEVAGTLDGEQVQATFSRQNGCEIDRWDRLATMLQLDAP
ncbi:MAG: SSI family serine proteinase inhibitor [Gaiellaceae bacterium]